MRPASKLLHGDHLPVILIYVRLRLRLVPRPEMPYRELSLGCRIRPVCECDVLLLGASHAHLHRINRWCFFSCMPVGVVHHDHCRSSYSKSPVCPLADKFNW